ncbi:MAG: hypothetical protein SFW35_04805 [Chitinophagales bacterium]|nr:hypothetical protein [Chitinophagales bacterium]
MGKMTMGWMTGMLVIALGTNAQNNTPIQGNGYTYNLQAPTDWHNDAAAASAQDLNAVFLPTGKTWDNAGTIIYSNVTELDVANGESIAEVMDFDINMYKLSSPTASVALGTPIDINGGKGTAKVIIISGGSDGTYQAIAYVDEKTVVPFVVLTSQSQEDFFNNYAKFKDVVASYQFTNATATMNAKR